MPVRHTRRGALGAAAALASVGFVRFPGEAAEFEYKFGHAFAPTHPFNVRMVEMWKTVRDETNGRLNVTTFPNSTLGGDEAMLGQMRAGAIQFVGELGAAIGGVVPAAAIEGLGFAFTSAAEGLAAMDGPLGDYIRKQIEAKGMVAYPAVYDIGMRQVISRTKPIVTPGDYVGFKMRVPEAKIVVDLFSTLGAIPTPLPVSELYTALQTHVVDGAEYTLAAMQARKLYEVAKYFSMTNHMWAGYRLLGNASAVAALPVDVRTSIVRNNSKSALLERRDVAAENASLQALLEKEGMVFTNVDTAPLRAKLGPYYARWRAEFGETIWNLLEKTTGKLG